MIYLVQPHWQVIQPVRPRVQRTSPWKSPSGCPWYLVNKIWMHWWYEHPPFAGPTDSTCNNVIQKEILGNIPSAPGVHQFAQVPSSILTVFIHRKKVMQGNGTEPPIHLKHLIHAPVRPTIPNGIHIRSGVFDSPLDGQTDRPTDGSRESSPTIGRLRCIDSDEAYSNIAEMQVFISFHLQNV